MPGRSPGGRPRPASAAIAPRALATAIDLSAVATVGGGIALLFHAGFFAATGCVTIAYYGLSTITLGGSAGTRIVERLQQRAPDLFHVPDRTRAHA